MTANVNSSKQIHILVINSHSVFAINRQPRNKPMKIQEMQHHQKGSRLLKNIQYIKTTGTSKVKDNDSNCNQLGNDYLPKNTCNACYKCKSILGHNTCQIISIGNLLTFKFSWSSLVLSTFIIICGHSTIISLLSCFATNSKLSEIEVNWCCKFAEIQNRAN